ncbi:pentapeptide repeat-containing protein [Achromobacter sp. JD417]|uniref:pentapeptide repeat-containing protein n=1 Tax=Achromobacter sp. JD417 TaxID=2893881 RepID=UPI0035A6798B
MNNQKDYFKNHGSCEQNYSGQNLCDVAGKKIRFVDCDFSYCVIERGYFHNAKFENCKFVGTRFISCNFRSATFAMCDFSYATFFTTLVSHVEISKNLPDQPNKKRDLIRTLRSNATSMGDQDANNSLLSGELKATTEHYKNLFSSKNSYYRKYSPSEKVAAFLKYLVLTVEGLAWGYGLSPLRLLLWLSVAVLLSGTILVFAEQDAVLINAALFSEIGRNALISASAVLDLALVDPDTIKTHPMVFGFLVTLRVVVLGLLITVLYRRYAR